MIEWLSVIAIAFVSLLLTALLRKYALARSLIDVPNARSSHSTPTPRGGGVSIVVTFVMAMAVLAWAGIYLHRLLLQSSAREGWSP